MDKTPLPDSPEFTGPPEETAELEAANHPRPRPRPCRARALPAPHHELRGLLASRDRELAALRRENQRLEERLAERGSVLRAPAQPAGLEEELRQAQKMEAIGRLASGVAHDFNNLLMGISGTADIGLGQIGPEHPLWPMFTEIRDAALSGARITRQLLAFARKRDVDPSVVDLGALVLGRRPLLARLLGEDIELVVEAAEEPAGVLCDEGQLEQVLMNLAVNARDAMPEGGRLSVIIRPAEIEGLPHVVLSVADTGRGIPEAVRVRMFEPFYTTKPTGRGTGLGLATVYGIVKRAGGQIEVASAPGEGTSFRILFPRAVASAAAAPAHPAPAPGAASGEAALVVEDEPLVRRAVRQFLERAGYRVLSAADGEEAFGLLREVEAGAVGLFLIDVVLPGARGPAVARRLGRRSPGARIIYMSAYPRDELIDSGQIPAEAELLQKPFGEAELLEALRAPSAEPYRPTLLLVDDQTATREACRELLESEGYCVLAAGSGEDARRLMREHAGPVAVAVIDYELPDLDGAGLVEELRAAGALEHVICISGRDEADPGIQEMLARTNASFVQKPFAFAVLASAVREGTAHMLQGRWVR